jgi:hypothetical protein
VRLIAHIVATPSLTGAVNATAPTPVTNAEFARSLGRALRRPALLRVPAAILRLVAGAFADELLLGGQRILPDKAQASGFMFSHENVQSALDTMLGNVSPGSVAGVARVVRPAPPMPPMSARLDEPRSAPAKQPVDQPSVDPAGRLLGALRLRAR